MSGPIQSFLRTMSAPTSYTDIDPFKDHDQIVTVGLRGKPDIDNAAIKHKTTFHFLINKRTGAPHPISDEQFTELCVAIALEKATTHHFEEVLKNENSV